MAEAGERFWRRLWQPLYHSLQGNPFAAMPSLHFGTSVMAARILSQVGPGQAALGWAYALTLGFGLVYLGEHYVIDLLAGLAAGGGDLARRAARRAAAPRRRRGRPAAGAAGELMRTEERRLDAERRRALRAEELEAAQDFEEDEDGRDAEVGRVPGAAGRPPQAARRARRGPADRRRDLRRLPEARRPRRRGPQARQRHLVLDRDRGRLQRAGVRRLRRALPRGGQAERARIRSSAGSTSTPRTRSPWRAWRPRGSSRPPAPAGSS